MEWKQITPETFSPREKIPIMEGRKKDTPPMKKSYRRIHKPSTGQPRLCALSVVGWPGSGSGSKTRARSTGKKIRLSAANQAQYRWRRCLPTGEILGVCTSRESGKGPGTAFSTKRWMRRWGTRATPTGPCVAQGDRRGSGRWLELGWCCSLRSDQFDDGLPGVEGGDDCFKG